MNDFCLIATFKPWNEPVILFQEISGTGSPSALHSRDTSDPSTTSVSDGLFVHLGGAAELRIDF